MFKLIGEEPPLSESHSSWQDPLADCVGRFGQQGGILALMPEYRPDLARSIAHRFDLDFFDYRQEVMMPLGWGAGELTLESLDQTLQARTSEKGIVAFNVEALLATKPETERRQWLNDFSQVTWEKLVILPLALYTDEAPNDLLRRCDLRNAEIPEQGIVSRLAF